MRKLLLTAALLVGCSAPPNPLEAPPSTAAPVEAAPAERERLPPPEGDSAPAEGEPNTPDDPEEHYHPPPPEEPPEDLDPCATRMNCDAGYRAFLTKAEGRAAPVTEAALKASLALLDEHPVAPGASPGRAKLTQQVLDGARAGWLQKDLAGRGVSAAVAGDVVVFDDPWVGEFGASLRIPSGAGPFPAVIVHPGHGESPADHLANRYGADFADQGVAVLVIEARAHQGDDYAAALTWDLLRAGHTLVGLRVYEVLVAFKYLRSRPDIAKDRVVIAGHSGGALVANLAARVEPRFAGLVTDLVSNYLNVEGDVWMDECAPDLVMLQELIVDWPSLGMPVLKLEYGEADADVVRQFVLDPQPP
ncbi:MAG: hypothetical protein GY898_10900 [Proteobacteria bacterium]|nr:hypothetical protein [Pseudomonadota bacterium]